MILNAKSLKPDKCVSSTKINAFGVKAQYLTPKVNSDRCVTLPQLLQLTLFKHAKIREIKLKQRRIKLPE